MQDLTLFYLAAWGWTTHRQTHRQTIWGSPAREATDTDTHPIYDIVKHSKSCILIELNEQNNVDGVCRAAPGKASGSANYLASWPS